MPPIFPPLTSGFGVGYAELGLMPSLVYVASGLMQPPAGILVDRLGPGRMLIGGLDLGASIAPPALGLLLDNHMPRLVFVVAAMALFAVIGSAIVVGSDRGRPLPATGRN